MQPALCGSVCGGGVREGKKLLAWLLPHFQSLPPLPVSDWSPSSRCPGADSLSGWDCICSRTLWALFKWTLQRDWQFLLPPQPSLVFTTRGYEALFSWHWNPDLPGVVWSWDSCLPSCPSSFYPLHVNVGPLIPPAAITSLHHTVSFQPLLPVYMNVSSLNPW